MATLDAVYADTVGGKVRGSHPLQAIFPANLLATIRGGSGVVLINETPPGPRKPRELNHGVLPVIALCVPNVALAVRWPKPAAHCFPRHNHALFPD